VSAALLSGSLAVAEPRTHDGLYLQAAGGIGSMSAMPSGGPDVSYTGHATAAGLMLGGTIGPVALGGGIISQSAHSAAVVSVLSSEDSLTWDVEMALRGVGIFADIYPDPHGGLHVQPFLGWSRLDIQGAAWGDGTETGIVAALGGGYSWWIGSEASLGVLGKLTYARLHDGPSHTIVAPSFLATVTYH
jgi:hypothetical protein